LVFNLYDFDGSKYISRDELVILMTNTMTAMNSMSKKAAPSIREIETKTDEYFKKIDVNNDKKITLREFKSFVKKDKQILEVLLNFNVAKGEDMGTDFGTGANGVPDCDSDLENECNPKELGRSDKKNMVKEGIDFKAKEADDGNMFAEEEMGEGDQFMAVKPWKGVVDHSVPSGFKPSRSDGEAPDSELQLEHIYGYRCHDTRNNLRYTQAGLLAYHTAGVGVILDQGQNKQKFFMEHNDDITSFAMSPCKKYVATGNIGPKPLLTVWDTTTMECKFRTTGPLTKGIKTLAFSNKGDYLAASAMDDDHMVAVWKWNSPIKDNKPLAPIAHGKGSRAKILSIGFTSDDKQVIATAIKEVIFFNYQDGKLKGKKGSFGKNQPCAVPCQAVVDNITYAGSFPGEIYVYSGSSLKETVKAHTGVVNAMCRREAGSGIISGGKDGKIIVWNIASAKLSQAQVLDITKPEFKSLIPEANSVCDSAAGNVLVGTRGGEIMEFYPNQDKPKIHLRSHCKDELWGLAMNPKNNQEFITVGQDMVLAIWDIPNRRQKKFARLDCQSNVVSYSSDGNFLAIGYTNGTLTILNSSFAAHVSRKDRKKEISEIKFSPNNRICAVGAHDQMILTYDVTKKFKPLKKLRGHSSTILHIQFSIDSEKLLSTCKAYEILFYHVEDGKQWTSGASGSKDEPWADWSSPLGWPVQGIFPPCADGSDINAVDRHPDKQTLASADDFGMVKLFKFPCPVEEAAF
jgi:microtubule-associated protein-like 6